MTREKSFPRYNPITAAAIGTALDVLSTVIGIHLLGWNGFHEANIYVDALWPRFGFYSYALAAPNEVAYWAAGGYFFAYVLGPMLRRDFAHKPPFPAEKTERFSFWFTLGISCLAPVVNTVGVIHALI